MANSADPDQLSQLIWIYTVCKGTTYLGRIRVKIPVGMTNPSWPCIQLLCAERNAPCQQDLAIDKAKPPVSAAK